MIADKESLHETDKLFRKLIAPSLGSLHVESNIYHHHIPVKVGPVLLPQRASSHGLSPQPSHHHGVVPRRSRSPKTMELPAEEHEDLLPMIDGGQTAGGGAAEYDESFAQSYQTASGANIRRQQPRAGTSLSSISCSASVPWTFYSTTKMKQLPLPQVQSAELLRASSPSPRGKRNVSVCSDRYLGTSRLGGGQPHHFRSKSAAEILQPIPAHTPSSDQVRRFEEERVALLQTRNLRRTTEIMGHRRDRKYHMCGSGMPIRDRYMVDSDEMDRLRQLIHARSTKRGHSPVSYTGRYGVRVTSGLGGTRQTKLTSESAEQLQQDSQGKAHTGYDEMEEQVQSMMPNVRISRKPKKKNGEDAFMTEFETADSTEDDDIQNLFGNLKSSPRGSAVGESAQGKTQGISAQEDPNQETSGEPEQPTAEDALLGMVISDDKIAAMEDSLRKIDSLKGGIKNVGHLEESELNLEDPSSENPDYGEEVFGKVRNDEELKEAERLRAKRREAISAKSRKADDSIMSTEKVSQAKSKMAEIYNFISPGQQEAFEKKFKELDLDGNGVITLRELFKRMYRGRENKETGRAFMQVFDLNKDQTIDEREFVIVAALNDKLTGKLTDTADAPLELDLDKLSQSITAYKEIFQVTDQDADGRLTLEDVMLVICLSGNPDSGIDPEVVQHVYDTIDADDSGTIDFMEYLTYIPFFLKLHRRMTQSRHITIAEVERARAAVKKAILGLKSSKEGTLKSF